jgi:uncharacterized protein (TIGR03437 family)
MSGIFRTVLQYLLFSFVLAGLAFADDGGGGGNKGPNSPNPTITGTVNKLPASGLIGVWDVSGHNVTVATTTKLVQTNGPLALGSCVLVFAAAPAYYASPAADIIAVEVDVVSAAGGCATAPINQHEDVEFFGAVTKSPVPPTSPGDWTIAGRIVHSGLTTRLDVGSTVPTGACAEVQGAVLSDASIQASQIKIDSDKSTCAAGVANSPSMRFIGTVGALPSVSTLLGTWTVSGRSVVVAASTEIEGEHGAIAVGSCVSVRGSVQADSSIAATNIETEEASECAAAGQAPGLFAVEGIVITLPSSGNIGDWTIGKSTVRVNAATVIDTSHGAISVGSCVEARGTLTSPGVLAATLLESVSTSGTCLLDDGIVSGASFTGGAVAPGQIVSIFGLNIGTAATHELELDGDRVKTVLSNVRVFFDGVAAPLLLVSPGQVNAVVPFEVAGKSSTQVQLQNNDVWSNVITIPVSATAPAIFTLTQDGKGQGAILNFDSDSQKFAVNGSSNAAKRGSTVLFYLTGTGSSDIPQTDGELSGSQLARVLQQVKVSVGGKDAQVVYAGSAPSLVAGISQINLRIPDDSPVGSSVPVVITVGDRKSQDGVTISIR